MSTDYHETDLLLAADYAVHEAGLAAAAVRLGAATPSLYHLRDTSRSAACSLVDRGNFARCACACGQPKWMSGMMRHGFRGAAEIAATLEHMASFAHLADAVPTHLFDLYYDAMLGSDNVRTFMARENPAALAAIETCFTRLNQASPWRTRRNSIAVALREAS
ncbi:cobaltochelatase subunit CobN [Bradyrhizobium lablabi]|uniref:cobaltochelatase subunit CobN n=1 Tax=Bradyrhizobium lablabi TaxID=722472 RepID=UPI0024BFB068|nr:cobaltochelatase subunit CobN [Bradyrhizobium lablabi]